MTAVTTVTVAACRAASPRPTLAPDAPYASGVPLDSALRDTVAWYRNEWGIPGAAFATFTCESRRLAWDGVNRSGDDAPLGPHALFPLEWHTVPMLATVAVRLERRGVLRLDAPLSELWPSAAKRAPWYASITLGALMSYAPPIPEFYGKDSASRVPRFSASHKRSASYRAARWYLNQRPDSVPSRWGPSAPAIVVATSILEQVTGKSVAQLLREEVFAPLGLRATFLRRGEYGPNQPRGHFASDNALRFPGHRELMAPSYFLDASELAISLPDYVTFLQAHLCAVQGRPNPLLTQVEALRIYAQTEPGLPTPLGWSSLNWDLDPVRIVQGQAAGFSAAGGFSKLSGRGALMLMNVQGLYATYATAWVWDDGLGVDPGMPRTRGEVPRR